MPETYRQAASILVLRPVDQRGEKEPFQILLLHKPRKRDAWQLPQGGIEKGETSEQAALRELEEEAGLRNVTLLGESREVYQYDFPPGYRRFRPDSIRGQRIVFLLASTTPDAAVTVDNKEIDAYLWIYPREFPKYLRRPQYRSIVQRLYAEAKALL